MYEVNYGYHSGETVVLLDIGNSVVSMNVVSDGMSVFTRDLSIGGSDITEEIQKQLNITYQEAEMYKMGGDRKSTRLNSSHVRISYAVFCLKKKKKAKNIQQ